MYCCCGNNLHFCLPSMYKQKEKTIFICRLMSDIPAGTKIETEMLKLVEVGSYGCRKLWLKILMTL